MPQHPNRFEMLRQLVASPSVSSVNPGFDQANSGVISLLGNWYAALGFEIEIQEVDKQRGKSNLFARLGSGEDGLVLAGHTDTVPYDLNRWQTDPFAVVERDGRYYGLGTCDMKVFFALIAEAAAKFNAGKLNKSLLVVATADEESTMCGARAMLDSGRPKAPYAVIGEPTNLKPIRMHKGIAMRAIRITGRSGHSSNPALGNSALEAMHLVMGALLKLRHHLQEQYRNDAFVYPHPTMNLGVIRGGDNPNRICAECELQIDFRALPGMDMESVDAQVLTCVQEAVAGRGVQVELVPLFDGVPPMETPADSPIVHACEHLTRAKAGAVDFGTEGPYFTELGTDTVIFGPGDIAQAHQPDEYVDANRLDPTVDCLTQLIDRFCVR